MNTVANIKTRLKKLFSNRWIKINGFQISNSNFYYSQFAEDALLQVFFKNQSWDRSKTLKIPRKGFYVDIGAYHPTNLSNTWWFYQYGWKGITVDPIPEVKELFDKIRPRDINLCLAISNHEGSSNLYSWGHSVMNTLEESQVQNLVSYDKTLTIPNRIEVKTFKLSSVLEKYLPNNQQINILTIDVEGHDLKVLKSNDWARFRPEIVVIELHLDTLANISESELFQFMIQSEYKLIFWAQPSLIFKDVKSENLTY